MVARQSRSMTSKTGSKDTKNVYKSSRKHSDRNSFSLDFPVFDVRITRINSVKLLLESDEADVVQKALHHLDKFSSLGNHQLEQLYQSNLYDSITKLCRSDDMIIKRFSFKLLVQLVSMVEDCKQKFLGNVDLIAEAKNLFTSSSDDVLLEYSSILLHAICDDPKQVDSLGRDEIFLESAFDKMKSHDSDILLHSIRLLNVIMRNSMLIESILVHKDFPFKNLQIDLNNSVEEIQSAALESFLVITDLQANPFWELLSSDRLIEVIYSLYMQEENQSSQKMALMVFKNLCKNQNILLKLSQSDYLLKFLVKLMDGAAHGEYFLGILMEFATVHDNMKILSENQIIKAILELLKASGSSVACDAIIKMSTSIFCLHEILSENIYMILMNVALNDDYDWSHRSQALTAFLKLINIQGLKRLLESGDEIRDGVATIIKTSSKLSFLLTAVSIVFKLSEYHEMKPKIAQENLAEAVFFAIRNSTRSSQLTTRFFNLTSNLMDQKSFQKCFVDFDGTELIKINLKSPSSYVRAAACNLISSSANYPQLCEILIRSRIVKDLMLNFDCTLCSDTFEMILKNDLSIKLGLRGRLDSSDKIQSGFYAVKGKRVVDFQELREVMHSDQESPIKPIFTINFEDPITEVKLGKRTILYDKNLVQLRNEIKTESSFTSSELEGKIKILAKKVSKFLSTTDYCMLHQQQLHLTELKFKFSSSVIPLGSLIYGKSFEAALLFKALADQLEIDASLHVDEAGKGWNQVYDETNVVDLSFHVGEMYPVSSLMARKYLLRIS